MKQHLHILSTFNRTILKHCIFNKLVFIVYCLLASLTIADVLPALGLLFCSRSGVYCIRWTGSFVLMLFQEIVANSHALRIRSIMLTYLNAIPFIKNTKTRTLMYWLLQSATAAYHYFIVEWYVMLTDSPFNIYSFVWFFIYLLFTLLVYGTIILIF